MCTRRGVKHPPLSGSCPQLCSALRGPTLPSVLNFPQGRLTQKDLAKQSLSGATKYQNVAQGPGCHMEASKRAPGCGASDPGHQAVAWVLGVNGSSLFEDGLRQKLQ